ncbi:MAG: N-6 DNA methylase [Kofleriaceae bacterium]|nr:N-6 DNA methylase [Kofleriaceae bacterium]
MARRHAHRAGDWSSVAVRLDEIISAHGGADPFEEALTLLVARLAHEASGGPPAGFVGGAAGAPARVNELVAAAAARWPGVVEPGRTTGLGGAALARCAAVLDGVALLGDELVGLDAVFEHLVAHVAKGQKGQFFTPRHVIAEVVAMLAPRPGEHVVDPACGSGGFLWHALAAAPGCVAWGFDVDPRAVRVARVMLAAHGAPVGRVACVDSLRRPALEDHARGHGAPRGFDVVLTNPPFAGDVGRAFDGAYELARGRVERDVLFVERVVELLRPGGRYAIVLPHNKVGGATWSHVRRWLLARTEVVAVLGLGRPTFLPHTSQKACVVIGRRRARALAAPPAGERVLFFVSERASGTPAAWLVRRERAIDHDLARLAWRCGPARARRRGRRRRRRRGRGDGDAGAGGDGGAVAGRRAPAARAMTAPGRRRPRDHAAGRRVGPALVLAPSARPAARGDRGRRPPPRRAGGVVSDTVDARACRRTRRCWCSTPARLGGWCRLRHAR